MSRQILNRSLLVNATVPLLPIQAIATGKVLVVAPHPDDETLGCGGAIAVLRSLGCQVHILVISDGTQSHPRSRKYPAPALRALREAETLEATAILGVDRSEVAFVGLPDGAIPTIDPAFTDAVAQCHRHLAAFTPNTIFLPWRYDPHPDHRATWQLIHQALEVVSASPRLSLTASSPLATYQSPRLIEYPIWDWDPKQRSNLPEPDFVKVWRLDISAVVQLKQQAIAAYRSQTTDLIDDDPEGFQLTLEMLANFTRPWELYLEVIQ